MVAGRLKLGVSLMSIEEIEERLRDFIVSCNFRDGEVSGFEMVKCGFESVDVSG